ncbi:MAG TPA: DNA repair protein RecN [Candidatus Saccharicenans sp.]|jgi:DNA repair protein RecN (Recombination protein N)|nr:DNA repair protein RecN [Candidatus Saccharicenans sp.]HOL44886.1 DNA repair protein RecN [Candidatus Saccharicenans sp.]HOM93883.1 DNA repair protein RecN [Candidatus Saccharicenans sp.]HOT68703.1 DNA repair protein RecN [Candidatus Saccharicenans sp.]HPC87376.1 DNA repair protein RecN [Candidatus Saccharicenans sp.]
MLRYLRIKNLATIEEVELELAPGFTILTGETGAGKSIIIDAIKILLGEKATPDLIRSGKNEARIEAIFELEGSELIPPEIELDNDRQLSLQRTISSQGLSKSYANGVLIPIKRLKELGDRLIDIYGQNDHIFLLDLTNHLRFLDDWAGTTELREKVKQSAQKIRGLFREKLELETRQKDRAQRLDFINFQIKEIEEAGLTAGEEEELLQERSILKNAEKIAGLVNTAIDLAYENEDSITTALKRLETLTTDLASYFPDLKAASDQLDDFSIFLKELVNNLIELRDKYAPSPGRLEEIEERLSQLDRLKRKYGSTVEEVLQHLKQIKDEKTNLEKSEEKQTELEGAIRQAFMDYRRLTQELSELRHKRARDLEQLLIKELAQLAMNRARFRVDFRSHQPDLGDLSTIRDTGSEEVEFLLSPNPGEDLKPLRRIASGGELSRIMLAFKVIGQASEPGKTLIFDEIDAGIGGQTADFLARKLKQLAQSHQIICITHLPQIASAAHHHYHLEKKTEKGRTYTLVKKLKDNERPEEIARLISGSHLTEASLQIARELLEQNLSSR